MKAKLLIITLFIISINFSINACAQSKSTDQQNIAGLNSFYTSYITEMSTSTNAHTMQANLTSIKKKYCTARLLNKIAEDMKSGKLDWDPFLKGQDTQIDCLKTLTVKKGAAKPNHYIVSYIWPFSKEKISINLTMVKELVGFKIDSVW
jgi:hypothetical protein